jgi:hypothetical protein
MLIQMLKKDYWLTQKSRKQFATFDRALNSRVQLPITLKLSQTSVPYSGISLHHQTMSNTLFLCRYEFLFQTSTKFLHSYSKAKEKLCIELSTIAEDKLSKRIHFS